MVDVDTPPRFSRLPEPLVGALREQKPKVATQS